MCVVNHALKELGLRQLTPSAIDPRLIEFTVVYWQGVQDTHIWKCHAEDTQHAIDQLMDAEQSRVDVIVLALPTELYNTLEK